MRTGRTNNLASRAADHSSATPQYNFSALAKTDDYAEQRGLEQYYYDQHPEAMAENGGLNKIRTISPNNPRYQEYMDAAARYLDRCGE